ncbi:MAG: CdaR family protein [Anaerolineae bacterium]|nr:CdaR family protein [Anaerolineae bacterium]
MRRWLLEAGTGALALVLALVVWVVAEQENTQQVVIRGTQVIVQGLEEGMALHAVTPDAVDINVLVSKDLWETWQASSETKLDAYVDVTGLGVGQHRLAVEIVHRQPGVQLLSVTPAEVTVELERLVQRSVPVRAEVMDSPPLGYDWRTPEVTPAEVLVSGPEQYVDTVAVAIAEVYLRTARSTASYRRPLSLRDKQGQVVGNVVDWTPRTVTVTVPIEQRPGYRDVPVRVRWQGRPARGYRISEVAVDPSIVTLFGSPAAIDTVPGYVETTPVNIEGASGNVVERLALIVPENVSVLGTQSVVVSVGIMAIEESAWVERAPMIRGLGDGLHVELSPQAVDVLVAGPLPRLETLAPSDVQVVLDLTGLRVGTHTLEPMVIVPEGIRAETLVPETIEVRISELATPTPTSTPTGTATPVITATATAAPPAPTATGG